MNLELERQKQLYQSLPDIRRVVRLAGAKALELQPEAMKSGRPKADTGDPAADIVTIADLQCQELILRGLQQCKAITEHCQLVAEEDTPLVAHFNTEPRGAVLTLDPINGTLIYSLGSKWFNVLVGIQIEGVPEWTFSYYPGLNFSMEIFPHGVISSGRFPKVEVPEEFKNALVYSNNTSNEDVLELERRFGSRGLELVRGNCVISNIGSANLFFAGLVRGFYTDYPSAYDGFALTHFAAVYPNIELVTWDRDGNLCEPDTRKVWKKKDLLKYDFNCAMFWK